VRTTQIYTHVLHMGPQGVVSPADRITLPRHEDSVRTPAKPQPPPPAVAEPSCPVAPVELMAEPPTQLHSAPAPVAYNRTGVITFPPHVPGRPRVKRALRAAVCAIAALAAMALKAWAAWRGWHV
jgi:hypothetical protein